MTRNVVKVGSGNVFADLGFKNAATLQVKADLTRQIFIRLKKLKLTQSLAAKRLGIKQPDVSKLMAGQFTGFSIDRLLGLLTKLDTDISIVLHARAKKKSRATHGTVRVTSQA